MYLACGLQILITGKAGLQIRLDGSVPKTSMAKDRGNADLDFTERLILILSL